jgi:uncharacterized repeat protein (TIGR03803 family)
MLAGLLPTSIPAGVVVTENISPGATSWPGTPVITTVTNPAGQTSVGESFNAVGGCTNYCETFTITSSSTLQTISIYAGQGSGTGTGTNLTLRLFDLGTQTAPNPSPYTPGTDLFNSGNGLSITYTPQTVGVLQFSFTGTDQAALQSGHLYAFEIDGTLNSQPLLLERTTNDTYSGGAAYRNRSWINATSARDFAMAVYASANPATNIFWGPNGALFHGFNVPVNGVNQDGANPAAGLGLSGGVLCGTTLNGGAQGAGTLFYVTLDGTNFNAFRSFSNAPDAGNPEGELSVSANAFFGTTFGGGSNGVGAVFEGQTNGTASVVRSFSRVSADNATNSGGASPTALIALFGNTIYGTTTAGGAAANGTVFSVATNGTSFSILHDFSFLDSQAGTNADGALPWGGLVLSGGVLYGTASVGGVGGSGVVFSVATNGTNFSVLYSFSPLDTLTATNADGAIPFGGLVASNGALYGTTFAGGENGRGTVFSIQTNGSGFAVLHHFAASDPVTATNSEGASPAATLILSGNVLYGAASAGGTGAAGSVFAVNTIDGQFSALHSFGALASTGTNIDGAFPVSPVMRLGNSLYGTAFTGGPGGAGVVFVVAIPSPAAVITNIIQNVGGSVTLFFLGGPNSTNIIQAAVNLTPPIAWQNVSTNVADANGAWQFTDTITGSTKFYRSYAP